MSHDRPCIRGCVVRDATMHLAACPDYGVDEPTCGGCVPRNARDGALVCDRCYRQMRRALDDAPDLVAHLRSIADPTKAMVYDRVLVSSSRPEMPAPVAADLTDASESIMRTLREWAGALVPGLRMGGMHAGALAGETFQEAHYCAAVILDAIDELANDVTVKDLGDALLTRHDGEPDWWSVADVAARWRLEDRERWAQTPCPSCDLKTIRVRPPRPGSRVTQFRCMSCDFEKDDTDDGGLWVEAFASALPEYDDGDVVAIRSLASACVAGAHHACRVDGCECACHDLTEPRATVEHVNDETEEHER